MRQLEQHEQPQFQILLSFRQDRFVMRIIFSSIPIRFQRSPFHGERKGYSKLMIHGRPFSQQEGFKMLPANRLCTIVEFLTKADSSCSWSNTKRTSNCSNLTIGVFASCTNPCTRQCFPSHVLAVLFRNALNGRSQFVIWDVSVFLLPRG